MNSALLKAVFINTILVGNVIAFIHSLLGIFGDSGSQWWPSLTAAGAVLYFFFFHVGAGKRPRTSEQVPVLLAITSTAAFIALPVGGLPLFYSLVLSCAGSWLYIHWYSTLDRSTSILQTGEALPELLFYNADNEPLRTTDFKQPLLLMFYRGNWCPLCTAQIREMADHYQQLAQRGYQVLFISPQSQEQTRKIAGRFSIPALFCEDRDNSAAKQLGIFHPRGLPLGLEAMGYDADTVMPTVIITDSKHRIIWLHETDNYRIRPEPAVFLQAIDAAV